MPLPPRPAAAPAAMPSSVYTPFAAEARGDRGPLCALNVGDTWMEPFEGGRMEDLRIEARPGMHRYGPTQGIPELIDALVEKLRARNGLACERDSVLVTAGATSGLANAVASVVDPGEEVLILAPFWPLIRGIVQAARGVPVEVPFYDRVASVQDALDAVRERLTERTVALYLSTPSNPTSRVLPGAWLEALAELARSRNLWLLSDEVYEDYVYRGEHTSIGSMAPERTVSFFSFSKTYGMAGNRVGYLVGPGSIVAQAHKLSMHSVYHAPLSGQLVALRALADGADWVANARACYRGAGEETAVALGLAPPEGSTFLFVDVSDSLDERGITGLLADCFEAGVLVSPGVSSGTEYEDWIRLCYTAAPPDEVREAVARLRHRLGPGTLKRRGEQV